MSNQCAQILPNSEKVHNLGHECEQFHNNSEKKADDFVDPFHEDWQEWLKATSCGGVEQNESKCTPETEILFCCSGQILSNSDAQLSHTL